MISRWWPRSSISQRAPSHSASRPSPRPWKRGREEDVQPAVAVVGVGLLVPAEPARDLAVDDDRERVLVVDGRVGAPPLAHLGLRR